MGFDSVSRRTLWGKKTVGRQHMAEHIYSERLSRWSALPDADSLRRTLFETYLPNDYLTKVDTATMAVSLEARCPFLDLDLVDFALRLPEGVVFPQGRSKALLRPLVRKYLPASAWNLPKRGFGVPVAQWLRGPLAGAFEEFVLRRGTRFADLFDGGAIRRIYAEHQRGADHSTRLWTLLALGVWSAIVVERRWRATDPLPINEGTTVSAA